MRLTPNASSTPMESSIVIKVNYGKTLRRFNARVADDKLGLNMDGLRDKIFQLFNFAPNTKLTLTYIDEDGDVVTLVDDEDLQDITRQNLNPLRISVRLNAKKIIRSSDASSGNSTSLRSPVVQPTFPNINSSVSDLLKSLPESKSGKILKHSADMAAKASSAAQEIAELSKSLSAIGLSYLKQASGSQPASETGSQGPASGINTGVTVTKDLIGCVVDETTSQAFTSVKSGESSLKKEEPSPAENAEEAIFKFASQPKNHTESTDASKLRSSQPDRSETQCESLSKDPKPNTCLVDVKKEQSKKFGDSHLVGKALGISYSSSSPSGLEKAADKQPGGSASSNFAKILWDSRSLGCNGSSSDMLSNCFRSPSSYLMTGVPLAKDTVLPQYSPFEIPFKRNHNHSDGAATTFHRGVRCDGCGVHPITGPRFKSKVKEDYDLCSICFAQMGNDVDYIRMDRPVTYQHPLAFKGLYDPNGWMRSPTVPQVSQGCGLKSGRPKLDSCFIEDVSVLDGSIMAPSSPFIKIWRMRNNGNIVWPKGTKLVWIGGDRLCDACSVDLQITSDGLAVNQELDVAVVFTASELPGKYISYWRMASPSGQNFGQRVWVLIQVDPSVNLPKKELFDESSQYLNLNFPPASSGVDGPELSNPTMELVEPVVAGNPIKEQEESKPSINDSLLTVVGDKSSVSPSAPGSSISNPIDLSEEAPAVTSATPPSVTEMQASSQDVRRNSDVEATLLKELEEMGFKQVDLNKEILRMNEYDLEQAVDDLCGVADWDPILDELEEMGFHNKEMNRKLLKKNNGSIKRVVMDLIAGEN